MQICKMQIAVVFFFFDLSDLFVFNSFEENWLDLHVLPVTITEAEYLFSEMCNWNRKL